MARETYWLLYDGDCRICTAVARWVKALDFRRRIRGRPIQRSRDLLEGLPDDEILEAMHLVSVSGEVMTGGESLPILLGALSGGPPLAAFLRASPMCRATFNGLYALLVEFRGRLVCRPEPSEPVLPRGRSWSAGP